MARISEQVLAGLARPTMAQGMFDLGAAIGGVPGQIRQKQKQEQFNEIMKMGQAAMTQNDPVNLSRVAQQLASLGYTKESQQFAQAAQQANLKMQQRERVGGLLTQAGTRAGITPEFAQQYLAGGGTLEELTQGREVGKQFAEPRLGRGRGELRAMVMQKGFNPQDTRMMSAYLGMADSFGVSREDAMKILTEERGTEIERAKIKSTATDSGDFGFAEGETWVDTQGNYYAQGTRRNKQTGKYETVFDPITPGAPDMPVGKLTPVMPGTMETSEERVGRELETAEGKAQLDITKATTIETAKNFDQQKTKASDRLPTVLDTLDKVDAMLQIVDGLETGSTLAQMSDLVQTALGYRETDMGIFQTAAKELLVGRITSFGSNPSDGERNAIVEMLPNIQNTPAINRAVLEMTKGRLAKERMAINYIQRPGITREDYVKFVDSLYPPSESTTGKPGVDPVTGNQVVDFNDIP